MVRRNTDQRRTIRDVFSEANRPLSTEEVLTAAQASQPHLGVATVYRTIKLLLEDNWLTTVKLPGQPPRYEMAGKPHHHHFCCNYCGRVFEVPGSDAGLAAIVPDGFKLEGHALVLYGQCAPCMRVAT